MKAIVFKYFNEEHRKEDNIKEFIDAIPTGSVFYDLGACLGWFSIYAAAIGLKTYAFEVDKFNFEGLEKNMIMNPEIHSNIRVFNKGIADKRRIVNLNAGNQVIGGHHKTLDLEDYTGQENIVHKDYVYEIEVIGLDEFITELELPFPEYLKVDIDGSEHAFLQGATKSLENAKGLVIELEESSDLFQDCYDTIISYGFNLKKKYKIPSETCVNFLFEKI
jgi:FkbM family methyltransferase